VIEGSSGLIHIGIEGTTNCKNKSHEEDAEAAARSPVGLAFRKPLLGIQSIRLSAP